MIILHNLFKINNNIKRRKKSYFSFHLQRMSLPIVVVVFGTDYDYCEKRDEYLIKFSRRCFSGTKPVCD